MVKLKVLAPITLDLVGKTLSNFLLMGVWWVEHGEGSPVWFGVAKLKREGQEVRQIGEEAAQTKACMTSIPT